MPLLVLPYTYDNADISPLLCGCYVYSSGLYKVEDLYLTGSGLYLHTAQVMTLSNLHTMLVDKMMSFNLDTIQHISTPLQVSLVHRWLQCT